MSYIVIVMSFQTISSINYDLTQYFRNLAFSCFFVFNNGGVEHALIAGGA